MVAEKRSWRFGVPGYLSHPNHFSELSVDSKKTSENTPPPFDKDGVMKLLRGAFAKAAIGEETQARALWAKAIEKGYEPKPKNVKGFEFAIEKGLRDTRR